MKIPMPTELVVTLLNKVEDYDDDDTFLLCIPKSCIFVTAAALKRQLVT